MVNVTIVYSLRAAEHDWASPVSTQKHYLRRKNDWNDGLVCLKHAAHVQQSCSSCSLQKGRLYTTQHA